MGAQNDFALTIDRAAGFILEATCSIRAAVARPLPEPHHRLATSALRRLERAQQDLFIARNHPWQSQTPPKPKQMQLL